MISLNIISDDFGDHGTQRYWSRSICFTSLYQKLPPKDKIQYELNVFGGYQSVPKHTQFFKGDFSVRENIKKMLDYNNQRCRANDLVVVIESDTYPCFRFLEYILEAEKTCPTKNSIRSGFSPSDQLLNPYIEFLKTGQIQWVMIEAKFFWFAQCIWFHIDLIKEFYHEVLQSKHEPFGFDIALNQWMVKNKLKYSVLVPNVVLHTSSQSAIFPEADFTKESLEHKGRRQTFCFLEDPLGFRKCLI